MYHYLLSACTYSYYTHQCMQVHASRPVGNLLQCVRAIGVQIGGARGAAAPPPLKKEKFGATQRFSFAAPPPPPPPKKEEIWATQSFWAARGNLGKVSFQDVSMFI